MYYIRYNNNGQITSTRQWPILGEFGFYAVSPEKINLADFTQITTLRNFAYKLIYFSLLVPSWHSREVVCNIALGNNYSRHLVCLLDDLEKVSSSIHRRLARFVYLVWWGGLKFINQISEQNLKMLPYFAGWWDHSDGTHRAYQKFKDLIIETAERSGRIAWIVGLGLKSAIISFSFGRSIASSSDLLWLRLLYLKQLIFSFEWIWQVIYITAIKSCWMSVM